MSENATVKAARFNERPRNTCKGCDASWKGSRVCHCSACHVTWSSVSLFDAHRSQDGDHGSCKSPEDITQQGRPLTYEGGIWKWPKADTRQTWYSNF